MVSVITNNTQKNGRFKRIGLSIVSRALAILMIVSLFFFSGPSDFTKTKQARAWAGGPLIIDHTSTNITAIPQAAITQAKSNLHIVYGHTSHGSQLIDGMNGLVTFANNGGKGLSLPQNIFSWNNGGTGGALDLHDGGVSDDVGYYPNWVNSTRSYLGTPNPATGRGTGANADVNVVIWSWCGQASGYTQQQMIDNYLAPMSQLELDYPGVTFVYMTGHLDGTGLTGNLHARNEQIRAYCRANNKVLYDFNDIEMYDPDGTYYGNRYATDGCNYDYNNSGGTSQTGDPATPTSGDRNWAIDWQNSHTQNVDWYSCGSAHTQPLNANQKAYAAWHLWARLGGWSGASDTQAPSVPTNLSGTATTSSAIRLNWTASTDNVGVTGYRVYRNGVQIATTTITNYSNTGLTPATQYSYTVSAFDAARNFSAQTSAISVTTAQSIPIVNNISGTAADGQVVSISGNNFGNFGGTIVSWDDFENHPVDSSVVGTSPIIGPQWSTLTQDPIVFSNQRSHSGGKSVFVNWQVYGISSFGWSGQGPYDQLYITFWRWMEGDYSADRNICHTGDGYNCNHKLYYLFGSSPSDLPQGMPLIPAGGVDWAYYNQSGVVGSSVYNTKDWNYDNTKQIFQRWEVWQKLNTPYTASNGEIKMWIDGQLGIDTNTYRHRYVDYLYDDFRLGNMAGGFEASAQAWFDDLYISTTQARVELGNASTWNACTHREIQVVSPQNWGNDSLNFTFRRGTFNVGDQAYVFVVDQNGNPSSGYPVTIVGSSIPDTQAPSTPSNLSAVASSSSEINLTWTASTDNVGVAGYRIYRNGAQIATTTTNSYSNTGLTPATQYSYTVSAFDAARNFSAQSAASEVATLARSFYVSTAGNDSNSGTLAQPWRTVRKAVQVAQAGDIVYIRAGNYLENNLMNSGEGNSGIAGKPITFKNYPGETPVIDGGYSLSNLPADYTNADDLPVFQIQNKHYIVLDGLIIQHGFRSNIAIADDAPATNVTIQNCDLLDYVGYSNSGQIYLDDTGGDTQSGADNVFILNNRLHGYIDGGDPQKLHYCGILSSSLRYVTIANNEIYDLPTGIWFKHPYVNGQSKIIRNNFFHDLSDWGIANSASDVSILNNLFLRVHKDDDSAVTMLIQQDYVSAYPDMLITNNTNILHNTIVDCDQGIRVDWKEDGGFSRGAEDSVIRNNIIFNFITREVRGISIWPYCSTADESRTTIDHNSVYTTLTDFNLNTQPVNVLGSTYAITSLPSSIINRAGNIQQSPLFVGGSNHSSISDFALAAGSPGKNAASDGADMGANISLVGIQGLVVTSTPSDLTPPTGSVSINSGALYAKSTSTILSLIASDVSGVTQMKLSDISTNFASLAALPFSSTYSWTLLGADGVKTVYAWFKDTIGNWNSSPYADNITLDTSSPSIDSVSVSDITNNSATINYVNNEATIGYVNYGLSVNYTASTTRESVYLGDHAINLVNLSASTTYYYQIVVFDRAGNQSLSINRQFTTIDSHTPDVVAPGKITNLVSGSVSQSSAILTWSAPGDDGNVGFASSYYLKYSTAALANNASESQTDTWWSAAVDVSGEPAPRQAGTAESLTLAGLSASTRYYVAIRAVDEAGNISSTSNVASFVTSAPVSNPPSSGGGSSGGGGSSSGGGGSSSLPSGLSGTTVMAPSSFTAIGAKEQILLNWQNPTAQDFVKVKIFRKLNISPTSPTDATAVLVYEGTAQQFIDTGLGNGLVYYYALYSYDRNLNPSSARLANAKTDPFKETVSAPKTETTQTTAGQDKTTTTSSSGRRSLVGVKSAEVDSITKQESQELTSDPRLVPLDESTYKVYQKVVAISERELSKDEKYIVAHFVHYGTPTTIVNGAGERGGSIASFKSAFGRLPKTETDWQDVIKIANGRWPTQKNVSAEKKSQTTTFAKVYGRAANMGNANDNAAVTVMTYGLRPALRNTDSEKSGILAFKYYYKRAPTSAEDWDIVRAIAYSGAKR
jgi:chitodextrinase